MVAAIDSFQPSERAVGKPLRMPISDVFKGQRGGLSVGGKLEGGALQVGAALSHASPAVSCLDCIDCFHECMQG